MKKIFGKVLVLLLIVLGLFSACDFLPTKSDMDVVLDTLNEISIVYQEGEDANTVTGDITLPMQFALAKVSWKSNNEDVITSEGKVTQGEYNVDVVLTVTVTKGEETLSKSFNITVVGTSGIYDPNSQGNGGNSGNNGEGGEGDPVDPTVAIKISEAVKKEAGDSVTVEGVVCGLYSKGFMLEDDTDKILVYLNAESDFALGDKITISGELSLYKDRLQFTNTAKMSKVSSGNEYSKTYKEYSATELETASIAYGERIKVAAYVSSITTNYVNMLTSGKTGVALTYVLDASEFSAGNYYNVCGLYMYSQEYNGVTSVYLMLDEVELYNNFTISFDVEGISPIKAFEGIAIGTLPEATKAEYTFEGWYNGDTLVTEETVFTEDTRLTAKFEKIVLNEDEQAEVDEVIALINALKDKSGEELSQALKEVEAKYNALSDKEKMMVSNYDDYKAIARENTSNSILAVFTFGENGNETHSDGSTISDKYVEENGDYTLTIENCTKVYSGARDIKGNSCIKMGTASATGLFTFTVPEGVNSVIIMVAGYKANDVTLVVNGESIDITTHSADGAYTEVVVDTTTTKTVSFATSTNNRAMIDMIKYVK